MRKFHCNGFYHAVLKFGWLFIDELTGGNEQPTLGKPDETLPLAIRTRLEYIKGIKEKLNEVWQLRLDEYFFQKILQCPPGTPVCIRLIHRAEIGIIGYRVGECVHRIAVDVHLPIRSR